MRVAIVSDIHGNVHALEAVLADLRDAAPDLILHGGDLPHGGSHPAEVVDRIRDLGWPGVLGNTDEQLTAPETLADFLGQTPALQPMSQAMVEMAAWTAEQIGAERIEWLRGLPRVQRVEGVALVHARPEDTWRSPGAEASEEELEAAYGWLDGRVVVYGHIHVPYVRRVGGKIVANSGSVSLPLDGDRRAGYLLVDEGVASIRRVEYDVQRELRAVAGCGMPYSDWIGRVLETARP